LSERPRVQNEDMQNADADDATRTGSVRALIA
jgi:hypothetical protein